MTWIDIQALRKSGRFQEAVDLGLQQLADDPDDFKLRTQVDWAFYGLVKNHVSSIISKPKGGQPAPTAVVNEIHQALRRYARQPKRRPDNALSNILRELSKIAQHCPFFPRFVRWVGLDGLGVEDWQYKQLDGKRCRPIAMEIARGLAKWIKAFPKAAEEDIDLALAWNNRVRPVAEGDDALWMDWDRVHLLRRVHRHVEAAEVLGPVIKAKKNESWVWAEAARLYLEEQPDLALACACRALECGSEPKFTVNVHRELAKMLADRDEFAQASSELALAISLRQEQGWGIDAELQDLINSSWYDPSAQGAERASDFYARHSQDALVLCFDSVEVKPATYLGMVVPRQQKDTEPGRKARALPRFAVRESNGASVSIVGPGIRCRDIKVGDPVKLVLGRQRDSDQDAIVQVLVRPDGASWDCTDSGKGMVTREAAEGRQAKVFVDRDLEVGIDADAWIGSHPPKVGEGVRFRVTVNRKTGRRYLFAVEPGPRPDVDVKVTTGHLKRSPKGFAFVDDAYVPPFLVETVPPEIDTVDAVMVYAKHPKEDRYGWRAVAISAA